MPPAARLCPGALPRAARLPVRCAAGPGGALRPAPRPAPIPGDGVKQLTSSRRPAKRPPSQPSEPHPREVAAAGGAHASGRVLAV